MLTNMNVEEFIVKSGYQEELVKACVLLDVVLESLVWGFTMGQMVTGVAVIESHKGCSYELPVLSQHLSKREVRIMFAHWLSNILRNDLNIHGASRIRGLFSKMTFGTHTGDSIQEIIRDDPTYIEWALDDVDGFELDSEASDALEKTLGLEDDLEGIF